MSKTWVEITSSVCTPYSINRAIGVIDRRTRAVCKVHQSEAYLIILILFDGGVFIHKENKFCVTVCKNMLRKIKSKDAIKIVLESLLREQN